MKNVVKAILKIAGKAVTESALEEGIKGIQNNFADKEVQIASSLNTNLVLTVRDSSCQDCADVILQENAKTENQIWILRSCKVYPFCVQIVNKHSGRCLNFTGGVSMGGHVGQYHSSLADVNIAFLVVPWKGFNLIVSPNVTCPRPWVLDVPGANAHSGAKLQQWEFNNSDAQCFKLTYL